MAKYMTIDGRKVEFTNEKNILSVIKAEGIDLPTFCYHSELSIYGACRMCSVEDAKGNIIATCSEPPRDGMSIYTNSSRIQKYRKMILELLLANHDGDCTICERTGHCRLQTLAKRYGVKDVRFTQDEIIDDDIDESSASLVRNPNKCIKCGDCVIVCEEIQGVGAIGFTHRGSDLKIGPAFNRCLADTNCVDCGQCRIVCPTGAIHIKNETQKVWDAIFDKNTRVVAAIAPAVRVALGDEFGMKDGEVTLGKMVAALKKLGIDEVYDIAVAADLTVIEESDEFVEKLGKEDSLPLFTSCCPAWVKFVENKYPEMKKYISSCKSPQQMFGTVLKEKTRAEDAVTGKKTCMVSIMPCTAKKGEASRKEFIHGEEHEIDVVITTQELAMMIQEMGLDFANLKEEALDMPFGIASGAGVIFGTTGGVMEAVLRRVLKGMGKNDQEIIYSKVRGLEHIKESTIMIGDREIKLAVVHGLKNADLVIKQIKSGEKKYDLIEVMACNGGCVAGGGQPLPKVMTANTRRKRAEGLYGIDRIEQIKNADENYIVKGIYQDVLKGNRHILHVGKHQ